MDTIDMLLNDNCRFRYGECEEAWYKGYDDSEWEEVFLPHDYAIEAPFSTEYSSGTGYLRGGTAWYRLYVRIPEEYKGKKLTVVFDGIYKNSMVWVNSYYMGKRPYGYSEISYDISHAASYGDDLTEISVKVIHEDIADSRWYTGSGIWRDVHLKVSEPVTTALHGVFFHADNIEDMRDEDSVRRAAWAEVAADCEIECGHHGMTDNSGVAGPISVRAVLKDKAGEEVLVMKSSVTSDMRSGDGFRLTLKGKVDSPLLWSVDAPYLYTLITELTVDGNTYVTDVSSVGIRDVRFDPDKGFFLNGINMKLKGVCLHHDGGVLGAAMKKEVLRRRLQLLKKTGCNAIRCSHNPHMPGLYELCDEMGFLVMDEAFDEWENAKNKWSVGHNVYPPRHEGYYEDFPEWHEKDLRTMIRRDRNHPSVILYSMGNEIDYPNDPYCHPSFQNMTGNNDANKPARERQYDPCKPNMERLSCIAARLTAISRDEDPTREPTLAVAFPELSADTGYIDSLRIVGYNYKEHLYEKDHRRFPDKVFLGSENGHDKSAWEAVEANEYICGQFLWTGIDYLGEAAGWPVHGSPAGLITTAGFTKDRFHERAALWGGSDYHEDNADRLTCKVWSPDNAVSDMASMEDKNKPGYLYQVIIREPYEAGAKTSVTERLVSVSVSGDGDMAGIDNGDLSDTTDLTSSSRRTYEGNAVAYIRRTDKGEIRVKICDDAGDEVTLTL